MYAKYDLLLSNNTRPQKKLCVLLKGLIHFHVFYVSKSCQAKSDYEVPLGYL